MVNSCAACTKSIRISSPNITCPKCCSCYHLVCVNITDRKLSEDFKSTWACPMCLSKEPRRDNSNTPVRVAGTTAAAITTAAGSDDENANARLLEGARKMTSRASPTVFGAAEPECLLALTSEIKLLRGDIGEIKTQIAALTDHLKICFDRIDDHTKKLEDTQSRLQLLEKRESEIFICRNKIVELRHEISTRAQTTLRNEIEISGINESPEENPIQLVSMISHKIGVALDKGDLDYAMRVGPRRRQNTGGESGVATTPTNTSSPRPLVVRFLRRHDRDAFLKSSKVRRNLTSTDIDVKGPATKIYINERLTQENRHLFRAARTQTKTADYKFCWIKNGTVYVRKREGNPAIAIKNMEELQQQLCPPSASQ